MIRAPRRSSLRAAGAGGLFLALALGLFTSDAAAQFGGNPVGPGFGGNPGFGIGGPGNQFGGAGAGGFGQGMNLGVGGFGGGRGSGGMGGGMMGGGSLPPTFGMMMIGQVIMDNTGGPAQWNYRSLSGGLGAPRGTTGMGGPGGPRFGAPRRMMRSVPLSAPSRRHGHGGPPRKNRGAQSNNEPGRDVQS